MIVNTLMFLRTCLGSEEAGAELINVPDVRKYSTGNFCTSSDTRQLLSSPANICSVWDSCWMFAVLFPSLHSPGCPFNFYQCLISLLSSMIKIHIDTCLSHAWLGVSSLWHSARFPGFAWESEPQLFQTAAPGKTKENCSHILRKVMSSNQKKKLEKDVLHCK